MSEHFRSNIQNQSKEIARGKQVWLEPESSILLNRLKPSLEGQAGDLADQQTLQTNLQRAVERVGVFISEPAAQSIIGQLELHKQEISAGLKAKRASLDDAAYWEKERGKQRSRFIVREAVAGHDHFFWVRGDGTKEQISLGEIMTYREWSVKKGDLILDPQTVPRDIREQYLIEEAGIKFSIMDIYHHWIELGKPTGGPDRLWSLAMKKHIFMKVLEKIYSPQEINSQWQAIAAGVEELVIPDTSASTAISYQSRQRWEHHQNTGFKHRANHKLRHTRKQIDAGIAPPAKKINKLAA